MDEIILGLEQGRMSSTALELLAQADVEKVLKNPTWVVCTSFQNSGTDTTWTCSLVPVRSLQLPLHLTAGDNQVGGGQHQHLLMCWRKQWSSSKIHA